MKAVINTRSPCLPIQLLRTFASSSHLQIARDLLDEEHSNDCWKQDPEAVGKNPIDDESLEIVVSRVAP